MAKAPGKTYIVRISNVNAEYLLDLKKFDNASVEDVSKFAVAMFLEFTECNIYVWSVSDDANIISLFR